MAPPPPSILLLVLLSAISLGPLLGLAGSVDSAANGSYPDFWIGARTCDGTVGECDPASEDFMDSETNRRILAGISGYISYGALTANRVPCSARGRSYYNCRGSGPANPYARGCSRITRCQRDVS